MNIFEITKPTSYDEVKSLLLNVGYEVVGDGYASEVYGKANSPFVLKVFNANDHAYCAFVEMVKHNQHNAHFPKLRGKVVDLIPGFKAIRMEKLTPYTGTEAKLWAIQCCISDIKNNPAKITNYNKQYDTDMLEACTLISELKPSNKNAVKFGIDLKAANVMMRGDTLVFIDPVN